jgi:uncharacterized protein
MGNDEICSWDDGKRALNITNHGYDFVDMKEVFDGRFCLTRLDIRKDYGELRYNMLVEFRTRIINVTFSPRAGKYQLISVRPASRDERSVYDDKKANS